MPTFTFAFALAKAGVPAKNEYTYSKDILAHCFPKRGPRVWATYKTPAGSSSIVIGTCLKFSMEYEWLTVEIELNNSHLATKALRLAQRIGCPSVFRMCGRGYAVNSVIQPGYRLKAIVVNPFDDDYSLRQVLLKKLKSIHCLQKKT